ncbi:site-specific DNA-methyltransferase [Helicobacter pylori]|nr:site-specific DNA-methyltransferase [Helicobacter pylori]
MQNKEMDQEKSVNEKNLEVFNRYFPGCLSIENDNQLTLDTKKLKALLGDFSEIKEEGYGLDFVGKKIALNQAFKKNHKILKPLNESISKHILIKGDSLDALKILKQSYSEKIKMIYIDPPYNTKSESFIYGDDFSQSNEEVLKTLDYAKEKLDYIKNLFGLKSHSGWLSFMYPRLLLARDLLKQDGVIFISIDDNEAAQLKLLCDEIFGEGNFVACAVWHKKDNASFLGKDIIDLLEYVLIYKKSASFKGTRDCLIDTEKHRELITKSSKIGERIFKKDCCLIENGDFTGLLEKGLYGSKQFCMEILEDVEIICGIPKNDIKIKGRFCWTQSSLDNETLKGGRIEIKSIKGMKPIFYKNFDNNIPFRPMRNLLSKKIENDVATYNDAANEIKEIFDNLPLFEYSKPSKLIKKFIKNVTDINSNDIILDFFAGSGTTAHAVLESNKSDYQKLSEGGGGYLMA